MVAKISNYLLLTAQRHLTSGLGEAINYKFECKTVTHGLGHFRDFGINLLHHPSLSISVDADDNLLRIAQMGISHIRRRQQKSSLLH